MGRVFRNSKVWAACSTSKNCELCVHDNKFELCVQISRKCGLRVHDKSLSCVFKFQKCGLRVHVKSLSCVFRNSSAWAMCSKCKPNAALWTECLDWAVLWAVCPKMSRVPEMSCVPEFAVCPKEPRVQINRVLCFELRAKWTEYCVVSRVPNKQSVVLWAVCQMNGMLCRKPCAKSCVVHAFYRAILRTSFALFCALHSSRYFAHRTVLCFAYRITLSCAPYLHLLVHSIVLSCAPYLYRTVLCIHPARTGLYTFSIALFCTSV